MISLTINGKNVEVEPNQTILDAAKQAQINIPTLCHHPKLFPYGACRLCLVEVQGARTLVPSCTTPVANNMVVQTDSERVKTARKFVLSMLFSERNHFCMYCQATDGDCELQNSAYAEDMTHWPFTPPYSPFAMDASHPDFVLDNNRCILCRRCVRVCGELVGNFTLGFEERGSSSFLVADDGVPLGKSTCISCGNCVQFCPTGALLDRRSAYQGRKVDLAHTESVCIECSLGCGRDILTRDNRLVRLEGLEEAAINQGLLCEPGRYKPVRDDRMRLNTPLIRRDGHLRPVSWEEALGVVITHLKTNSSEDISAFISPRQSIEALNLFTAFFRDNFQVKQLGLLNKDQTASVTIRLAQEYGVFESEVSALADCDLALVLGADVIEQHQVAGFMLRRQAPDSLRLISDPDSADLTAFEDFKFQVDGAKKPVLIIGQKYANHENINQLREVLKWALDHNVKIVMLKGKANAHAAALFGIQPSDLAQVSKLGFMILGDQHSCENSLACLTQCDFKVVLAAYQSDLTDVADVVLPCKNWLEETGSYLSTDGKLNVSRQALQPDPEVKSSSEVLMLLANRLGLDINDNWMSALINQPTSLTLSLHEA